MATTWDFVLISPHFFDIGMECGKRTGVKEGGIKRAGIKKLWSIDDWEWRNQQELRTFSDIERRLDEGKIIAVNFETDQWKDMGMYIEKEKEYIYSLWINTEGVPELDSDMINEGNIGYYEKACRILEELISEYHIEFRVIAIGVECDVQYHEDIEKMMHDSRGVTMWIFNKNGTIESEMC